jgi:hypothetical protein
MNTLLAEPAADNLDPLEQMARDDLDDWVVLRLVVCVTVAIVAMAAASTLSM